MKNRLPFVSDSLKISIICEGNEEYEYIEALKNIKVWNDIYEIALENAGGNGNVVARYQNKYQNGSYDVVLIFCDTDKKPYEQYRDIKDKINSFHGNQNAANAVVIFGNPCTMQIILLHWKDVRITTQGKGANAELIKECTGVENYKAHRKQREGIWEKIDRENYKVMKERVKALPDDDIEVSSSNIGRFLEWFESSDRGWIDEINDILEE